MKWKKNLTRNEKIVKLKLQGCSSIEIANVFSISARTVDNVVQLSDETFKVLCYCPKCGKDRPYYLKVTRDKEGLTWTGKGVWPRFCEKHQHYKHELALEDASCRLEENSESEVIGMLSR